MYTLCLYMYLKVRKNTYIHIFACVYMYRYRQIDADGVIDRGDV